MRTASDPVLRAAASHDALRVVCVRLYCLGLHVYEVARIARVTGHFVYQAADDADVVRTSGLPARCAAEHMAMWRERQRGVPVSLIAAQRGKTYSAVYTAIMRIGDMTATWRREAWQRHRAGVGWPAIAREFGMRSRTACREVSAYARFMRAAEPDTLEHGHIAIPCSGATRTAKTMHVVLANILLCSTIGELAERIGVGRSTVRRAIMAAVDKGLLGYDGRRGHGYTVQLRLSSGGEYGS